jgi:hypothetical protein
MNQQDMLEQAKVEGRAKIIWGESPKQTVFFMRARGVSLEEAMQITEEALAERRAEIRTTAFKQIILGIGLQVLPVGGYIVYAAIGGFSIIGMLTFGVGCAGGLYGLYCLINGIWALAFPKEDEDEDESV